MNGLINYSYVQKKKKKNNRNKPDYKKKGECMT